MSRLIAVAAALLAWGAAAAESRSGEGNEIARALGPPVHVRALSGAPQRILAEARGFYARRAHAPAWMGGGAAVELISVLERADEEGLDPADYPVRTLWAAAAADTWSVDGELAFTRAFLTYAHHVREGRVPPSSVGASYASAGVDAGRLLEEALARGVQSALEKARPPGDGYARLRAELAELRAIAAAGGWPRVGRGAALGQGSSGPRVAALRARLAAERDLAARGARAHEPGTFDEELEAAVRSFQRRHGLEATGRAGPATLAALALPVERRIQQVALNLERLRWLPDPPEGRRLVVNVAAFELVGMESDSPALHSAAVVGQRDWPTPLLQDEVQAIEVHPKWHVPPKIAREDLVPLLSRSPGYAARVGMRVYDRETGERVDPALVRWSAAAANRYRLVQEAGPENPLGDTKIVLGNALSVHLHSTSAPATFQRTWRASSHGCIRVQWAHDVARFVLADPDAISVYDAALEGDEPARLVPVRPVPVFIVHATAWGDAEGRLQVRADPYRVDARLARALDRRHPEKPKAPRLAVRTPCAPVAGRERLAVADARGAAQPPGNTPVLWHDGCCTSACAPARGESP